MRTGNSIRVGLVLTALAAAPALADTTDTWLTTKAKIALLTTEGVSVRGVRVDTVDGEVTLRGRVKTQVQKDKATLAVGTMGGVKSVTNLLQVIPEAFRGVVKASDDAVRKRVQAALASEGGVEGVKVASVNNGVVLLSGKASTLAGELHAIELARNVGGVTRVASEIETRDK